MKSKAYLICKRMFVFLVLVQKAINDSMECTALVIGKSLKVLVKNK